VRVLSVTIQKEGKGEGIFLMKEKTAIREM
jgi:hypothetical protein